MTSTQPPYRLAANENPYPPLPSVVETLRGEAAQRVNRYPDWFCDDLRAALAQRLGVPFEHVAVGVGSVALTQQLVQATADRGDEVVYAWQSFEAYPHLVRVNGAQSVPVPLHEETHDLDAMAAAVGERTRLVIVCNPNNPTSTVVRRAALERFLDRIPPQVPVVLDEAYREFVSDDDVPDGLALHLDRPNVVVLRTFSKAYGLAGLRVGYAVAREPLATAVRDCAIAFGVTDLAQQAALASLRAEPELRERVARLAKERDRVVGELRAMGWTVPPAEANFYWLRLGERSRAFAQACREAGVAVRAFDGEGVRITVGDPPANDALLRAAADFGSTV
ncbi:histidinol-phosphate transaminase [Salinactinospora qingdaonensis]|uniref:Histidinol-phosphate aminotransferase n=1 Tax=Salinactinospora qingdaonensis TaxID=702744 RepID=A0ABP7ERL1_9ACTN